jgi:hypothetical protein
MIGTAGPATVGYLAFTSAMLSAMCKPYLVLTEYMLTGWLGHLLGIVLAGVLFSLIIQVVTFLGSDIKGGF